VRRTANPGCGPCCSKASTAILRCPGPPARSTHNRSADTLAVTGWIGPANHAQTAPLAAVVRSWEDRFGVRVTRVGFDTLVSMLC
jgi:hypothetical protein